MTEMTECKHSRYYTFRHWPCEHEHNSYYFHWCLTCGALLDATDLAQDAAEPTWRIPSYKTK